MSVGNSHGRPTNAMKKCKFPDGKPSFLHADAEVGVASLWTLLSDPAGASKPM
jgi:hypothetical protein